MRDVLAGVDSDERAGSVSRVGDATHRRQRAEHVGHGRQADDLGAVEEAIEVGEIDERPFFAMSLHDGPTLRVRIEEGLSLEHATGIARALAAFEADLMEKGRAILETVDAEHRVAIRMVSDTPKRMTLKASGGGPVKAGQIETSSASAFMISCCSDRNCLVSVMSVKSANTNLTRWLPRRNALTFAESQISSPFLS